MKSSATRESTFLAHRQDFRFGNSILRPSLRTIVGPSGVVTCEPRVMQVLLALIDAKGAVVSREDLINLCWEGRIVGDDAVNRAIAAVRKSGAAAGSDYAIETIPRIGYRIGSDEATPSNVFRSNGEGVSRRTILAGSAAGALATGIGVWSFAAWSDKAEYLAQVEQARQVLETPAGSDKALAMLEKLTRDAPGRAEAWGLLAYARFRSAETAPFQKSGDLINASEQAATRALSIESEQSDALLARALLGFSLAGWKETEDRTRQVIDLAPNNCEAIEFLTVLLQCVGRCIESRQMLNRALAIRPRQPTLLFKKALKHWIFGELADADRVIDGALQLWPKDEWIWNTRLTLYAFTDRPSAAIAMLDDEVNKPATMLQSTEAVWRSALQALATRTGDDIAIARATILNSAPHGPANAGQGVMLLSTLGELDAAYEIANGLLLARGDNVGSIQASNDGRLINSQSWRRTQWLFIPATVALRVDPRFEALCEGMGLLDYWERAGVWPDEFVRGSLSDRAT